MLLKKLKIYCGEVDDLRGDDGFQKSVVKFSRINNNSGNKCLGCIFGSLGKDCGSLSFRYSNDYIRTFISSMCLLENKRYIPKEIKYAV